MLKFINLSMVLLLLINISCVKVPLDKQVLNYWEKKQNSLTDKDLKHFLCDKSLNDKKVINVLKSKSNTEYVNIKVLNIKKIDKKTSLVTIQADAKAKGYVFKGVKMKQTWILEHGQWKLYVTEKLSPF